MRRISVLTALAASLVSLPAAASPAVWPGALGMTGWGPALLVLAGLVMVAVDVFVIPGLGWTGVLGLLALLGGVVLALAPGPMDAALTMATLVSSITLIGIAAWAVASRLRAGHPLLGGVLNRDEYVAAPARPELKGVDGVTLTDLRPAGVAEIGGERLDVVSEGMWVPAGTPVRVVHSEGYRHVVRAVPTLPPAAEAEQEPAPEERTAED